jgi:ankyrin repeat protein
MYASFKGHVGVVRWLLDKGAALNERNYRMCTALWFASCHDQAPVVRLLVGRGAGVTRADIGGVTPLMIASDRGHLEVVRFLLGHPRVHPDRESKTALWHACCKGRGAIASEGAAGGRGRPHHRQPAMTAPPPWSSPSRILVMMTSPLGSPPRAVGSVWRHWR